MPFEKTYAHALATLEARVLAAWTQRQATPFPGQIDIVQADEAAERMRREIGGSLWRAERAFREAPCLGVWATLVPLASGYGASDREVYRHLSAGLGLSLDAQADRERFKTVYRRAAQAMGVALAGRSPTDLFFAPLGVVDAQLDPLAVALLTALDRLGPPAIEDIPSAVAWQRRALAWCPEGLTRLRAAVRFDPVGHYTQRADRWRRRLEPEGPRDAALFRALDVAERRLGIDRACLVAPPRLAWVRDGLALVAEESDRAQSVALGAFPRRLHPGQPERVEAPWPAAVRWSAGLQTREVPVAPAPGEVLLFDAETGDALARLAPGAERAVVPVPSLVVLAAEPFEAPRFGPAIAADDPAFHVVWVDIAGATHLIFADGRPLTLEPDHAPGLRVQSPVLGRDGTRALRAGTGVLELRLDPRLPVSRILRVSMDHGVVHRALEADAAGMASVPFSDLGLGRPGAPTRAVFEVLVPGAEAGSDARAELRTACDVWPGVAPPQRGQDLVAPIPPGLDVSRSAGLLLGGGVLRPDPDVEVDMPILAVPVEGALRRYALPRTGVRVWHLHTDAGTRTRVPRGARLVFGHAQRQDTLEIDAPGCEAVLHVLGRRVPRAFVGRSRLPLGVESLAPGEDDRILLEHADGTVEVLARLSRVDDPAAPVLDDTADGLVVTVRLPGDIDALGLRVETACGAYDEGGVALGARPVPARPPTGCGVEPSREGTASLRFDLAPNLPAARVTLLVRKAGATGFEAMRDAWGRPFTLGRAGTAPPPSPESLRRLATMLAEPTTPGLARALSAPLAPLHRETLETLGARRFLRPLMPALTASRQDGGIARHDIVSGAPWLFGADLSAFGELGGHPDLAPLGRMAAVPAPGAPPDPRGPDPFGAWIDRLGSGAGVPPALDGDALARAFAALRARRGGADLADLSGDGPLAVALRLLTRVDAAHAERLRDFDRAMGSDEEATHLVALLERFARASRLGEGEAAFAAIVARTGLERDEAGQALSVAIRLGIEAFAQFLVVWHHAAATHYGRTS